MATQKILMTPEDFDAYVRFRQTERLRAEGYLPPLQPAPRKLDYNKATEILFTKMFKGIPAASKCHMLWKTMRLLYTRQRAKFRVVSEYHKSETGGRGYYSVSYADEDEDNFITINFHIYGEIVGSRFVFHSVDVLMGDYEQYRDAIVFAPPSAY